MKFSEYQDFVNDMKVYKEKDAIIYPTIKLAGETGEVSEKVGKTIRDNGGIFSEEGKVALIKELGDVLWYVSALADDLGYNLEHVALTNMGKLNSRKDRGVVHGSGDER